MRLEFGPGESAGHYVTAARRDQLGKDSKFTIPIPELATAVPAVLDSIHNDLYRRADEEFRSHRRVITNWGDFVPALNEKNVCLIPHCLTEECEDQIKDLSKRKEEDDSVPEDSRAPSMGAKSLCIPFEQPEGIVVGVTECVNPQCKRKAEQWCMFGRKYLTRFSYCSLFHSLHHFILLAS